MEAVTMALRAPGLASICCMLLLFSCTGKNAEKLPRLNSAQMQFTVEQGILKHEGIPVTAMLYELSENGRDTVSITSFVAGREDGEWKKFFNNGRLAETRHFSAGKKTGDYLGWWPDGSKRLEYHFSDGELNGVCRDWAANGTLISEMNYVMGHESGAQQQFYTDGKIKANYTIIDGRRYGLLGTKNCVNVSDSIFKQ